MKPLRLIILLTLASLHSQLATARAESTIAPDARHAYAANCGWLDARAGTGTHGVAVGEFVCSGFLYAANCGWLNLGTGAPTNGVHYSNTTGADYGVNHLGDGRLRGLAWAANLGWVNFADTGNPRVDLGTGDLSGQAWSANVGWINLTGLRVTHLAAGADTDGDGIPDAWELQHAPLLTVLGGADTDGDSVSDLAEYQADTNPLDSADAFHVISLVPDAPSSTATLTWTSRPTRRYRVWESDLLSAAQWVPSQPELWTVGAGSSTLSRTLAAPAVPARFYRVEAARPLSH